jgi:hypothetical protein
VAASRAASTTITATTTTMTESTIGKDSPMIVANNLDRRKEKEREITILNDNWDKEQSKADAISRHGNDVNEVKEIFEFLRSNGRLKLVNRLARRS